MIVIQLSDPHIVAPGELLYGRVDTAEFLARSVAEINRLDPLPDVAVMTGDLVDHGNPAEYEHLRRIRARTSRSSSLSENTGAVAYGGIAGPRRERADGDVG